MFLFYSCGKKNENIEKDVKLNVTTFGWKDGVRVNDLPDFRVKGMLGGKEVKFESVILEKWHGSNENVLNFSLTNPQQPCGYIEKYEGFQIVNKGSISTGEFIKSKFSDTHNTYSAFFKYINPEGSTVKSDAAWNCVLNIESTGDKIVSGKIILCFNDASKSWIAGSFEAKVCNN